MKSLQVGLSVGIGVLLAGTFLVDSQMALGFTPWLMYVVPLSLTYWVAPRFAPIFVAGLCTVLLAVGYVLSSPGAPEYVALTNRMFGAILFWVLASLIVAYKGLVVRLSQLTEQLRMELNERSQDLGRVVTALRTEEVLRGRGMWEGEDSREKTRVDLEQLGKQLEQLQRDLLQP